MARPCGRAIRLRDRRWVLRLFHEGLLWIALSGLLYGVLLLFVQAVLALVLPGIGGPLMCFDVTSGGRLCFLNRFNVIFRTPRVSVQGLQCLQQITIKRLCRNQPCRLLANGDEGISVLSTDIGGASPVSGRLWTGQPKPILHVSRPG